MIINEAIGLVPANEVAERIGIKVIDNSNLYDALVFGLLRRQPSETPISYSELADLLSLTPRVIGSSVNRLIKDKIVTKQERGRLGAVYVVYPERYKPLPTWIIEFTAALIELHNNPDLKKEVVGEVEQTQFFRGFEQLKRELRQKFYKPRDGADKPINAPLDLA
jgi:DNA-binding transcriptional ArsR family regulator